MATGVLQVPRVNEKETRIDEVTARVVTPSTEGEELGLWDPEGGD